MSDERIWRMPLYPKCVKMIQGINSDLINVGSKFSNFLTASVFVGEFRNNIPWCHLDVAGTVMNSSDNGYKSKGASGVGAKLLFHFANQ